VKPLDNTTGRVLVIVSLLLGAVSTAHAAGLALYETGASVRPFKMRVAFTQGTVDFSVERASAAASQRAHSPNRSPLFVTRHPTKVLYRRFAA
jgi:hypothetical protein